MLSGLLTPLPLTLCLLLAAASTPAGAAPPALQVPRALRPAGAAPPGWQEVANEQGIVVYKRKVPESRFVEFRARAILDAPVLSVLAVLDDTGGYSEWVPGNLEMKILEKVSETDEVFYQATDAPWPAKSRDYVGRFQFQKDDGKRSVEIEFRNTSHSSAPVRGDRVRMPFVRGLWVLQAAGDGRSTRAELGVHMDPGGWIPAWLANWVTRYFPLDTLKNLQRVLREKEPNADFVRRYKGWKEFGGWEAGPGR